MKNGLDDCRAIGFIILHAIKRFQRLRKLLVRNPGPSEATINRVR